MEAYAMERYGQKGRCAFVTGGTKGIGRACVEELAKLGAKVLTCSRGAADVDQAVQEWKAAGLDVEGFAADVASDEGRRTAQGEVAKRFGGQLHILVHNVGTNIRKPTAEYTLEEYRTVMSTNFDSCYLLTQVLYPALKSSSSDKSIILISSIAGGPTSINSGTIYAATKAAMDQMARNWACEWAGDGIRVNSVKPGYTETPLVKHLLTDKARLAKIESTIPMARIGQPSEVAGLVGFLASPAAAYVTGTCIAVDGGFTVNGMW